MPCEILSISPYMRALTHAMKTVVSKIKCSESELYIQMHVIMLKQIFKYGFL